MAGAKSAGGDMGGNWEATPDGGFFMNSWGRRIKAEDMSPWGVRAREIRLGVERHGIAVAPLQEMVEWARQGRMTKGGLKAHMDKKGWTTLEDVVQGWARARRWRVVLDAGEGTATFRPLACAVTPSQSAQQLEPDGSQAALFDLSQF